MKRFQLTGIKSNFKPPGGRGGIMVSDMVKEFKFSEESIGA